MKTDRLLLLLIVPTLMTWSLAAQENSPADDPRAVEVKPVDLPGEEAAVEEAIEPPVVTEAENPRTVETRVIELPAEELLVEEVAAEPAAVASEVRAEALPAEETPAQAPEATLAEETPAEAPLRLEAEPAPESAASPPAEAAAVAEAPESAIEGSPHVVYPTERPEWVDAPPVKQGEIDRIAVTSGPHYSLGEARRQLDEAVQQAANDYVNRHLGSTLAASFISFQVSPVQTFEERPEFSFGPMYQAHAMLEFNEAFRHKAESDWREALTISRLLKTGLGVAAVFMLLSIAFGYAKADNATRGYYTRRLRFGAATVILALAVAAWFAVRWIPWMI